VRAFPQVALTCTAIGCIAIAVATVQPSTHVSANSESKTRGAELFATHGCAHCHGPAGVGGRQGPDLQLVRKRLNKDQITHQIHDGGKSMPAFADTLTSGQIDDLVSFLRAKRKLIVVPPKPSESPTPTNPDPD
jgi:mono/diheme cytochrome c family protein